MFQVGFSKEGKFLALDMKLYCNAGNSLDLSMAVSILAEFKMLLLLSHDNHHHHGQHQ